MTAKQRLFEDFKNKFIDLCVQFDGKPSKDAYCVEYFIPTHLGPLRASIHPYLPDVGRKQMPIASIYLRFEEHTGGRVYDTLCDYDFNGWSGKWNVCVSGGIWPDVYQAALDSFRLRMGKLTELGQKQTPQPVLGAENAPLPPVSEHMNQTGEKK